MISTLVLARLLTAQDQPTAAQMAGKALARYMKAQTLVGQIKLVSSAAGQSATVTTDFQYERPARVYLHQVRYSKTPKENFVTADGEKFSYEAPMELKKTQGERLIEFVIKPNEVLVVGRILQISQQQLSDYNAPLWIAFGLRADLDNLRGTWASLEYLRSSDPELVRIGGDYREYKLAETCGRWEMTITKAGDLKGYSISLPVVEQGRKFEVRNDWQINLDLEKKPDPSLFTLKVR
ncbi:MAG: hypothetical protein K8R88_14145 [Armatimonadetes bacterium]|nr:hypothetical protein [Armatimonadota bacterium]